MKLLMENWRRYLDEVSLGFDMAKAVEYTAFVLDDVSHKKLAKMAPQGWKVYAHHMTMIPPTDQKQRIPSTQYFKGCLKITGVAQNKQVMAVRVDVGENALYFKTSGLPHVTIAINPEMGGEPAMSNDFVEQDFQAIAPIEVCGEVKEIMR